MTIWGYLVLLFIIGAMVEDYQFTKHELELERIKAIVETKKRITQ